MKHTIQFISVIIGTLLLAFLVSLLFEIQLVASHWSRVVLVILLMLSVLLFGFAWAYQIANEIKNHLNKK